MHGSVRRRRRHAPFGPFESLSFWKRLLMAMHGSVRIRRKRAPLRAFALPHLPGVFLHVCGQCRLVGFFGQSTVTQLVAFSPELEQGNTTLDEKKKSN